MSNVTKVSIALTAEMNALVREAVQSGEYASTSEVVREALREWKQRRTPRATERHELLRLWDAGIASGPGAAGSMDDIKREARRRMAAEKAAKN